MENNTISEEESVMIIQNKHHMENQSKKLIWEQPNYRNKYLKIFLMIFLINIHPKNTM